MLLLVVAYNYAEAKFYMDEHKVNPKKWLYVRDSTDILGRHDFYYIKLHRWKLSRSPTECNLIETLLKHNNGASVPLSDIPGIYE